MLAMNKRLVFILLSVVTLVLVIVVVVAIQRNVFLMSLVEQMAPGAIPARSYARNLASNDPDLVRESLALLTNRKDPIAVKRAVELLQSTDDYIWLNAAEYLGVCRQSEAVPYLIKALRHTAWRADKETVLSLRNLTAQDFGTDFSRWQEWWLHQHPDSTMDWTNHLGFSPRFASLDGRTASSQQDGSQQVRSQTNQPSAAAGSQH